MIHRTLVIHTGGVGDFLCTLPALQQLGRHTRIEIAGIPERAALAEAAGIAAAVHDLNHTGFHTVFSAPDARLRAFCADFDAALVWMADDDGTITANLTRAGIPAVQCFPGLPPDGWERPAACWYAECTDAVIKLPFELAFPPAPAIRDVVIHPGSGDPKKNWPREYFAPLADRLSRAGHTVHWCLGPAEEAWDCSAPMLPPMPLVELAGVLARTRLFIGNDSGVSHLASVAGCRTLVLFGPTDPAVWRPMGPHTRVLHGTHWPATRAVEEAAVALAEGRDPEAPYR